MAFVEEDLTKELFEKRENEIKHPSYDSELAFYDCVKNGNIEGLNNMLKEGPSSDAKERGELSPDPVRNAIYHHIVMTAMITRFCIEGGMEQEMAYALSDLYINKADRAKTREEVQNIQNNMILDFAYKMRELKKKAVYSKQIVICMDYISENLHKNITVEELADYVNLNETYLSKLFKKEMGQPVSSYIRDRKIEYAESLLKYSDKSSIDIANDLGFSSHSYFISVFKKKTGLTPKEYRNKFFRKKLTQK